MRRYDYCYSQAIKKCALIVLLCVSQVAVSAQNTEQSLPKYCTTSCVSTYGAILGISLPDTKAYSNCRPECVVYDPNIHEGTYTGIKWQCVEFARRWLLQHKGAVYGDVDIAADIWTKIDQLTDVATNEKIPLNSYVNGSTQPPKIGDLLIYAKAFYGTGHVAVITGMDHENGLIKVGEQNYSNTPWLNDYARTIKYIKSDGRYWVLDGYILGWKQIQSM